jgi:hypothetical protein
MRMRCYSSLDPDDHIGPIIAEPVCGLKHWLLLRYR